MKIGIVVGSVREGRVGMAVGAWVAQQAANRDSAEYEMIDLKTFDLPVLTAPTVPMTAQGTYADPRANAWGAAMAAVDGYIFVTAEYNHGIPGAFKNAIDTLGVELVGKPIAFVAYGADGGVRAVEQWRQVVANFSMHDVRAQLALGLFTDFKDGAFEPLDRRYAEVVGLFDQLEGAGGRG